VTTGGSFLFLLNRRVCAPSLFTGYYSDDSLSPEDFETLKNNLQQKASAARAERQSTDAAVL
jgi:hypothetical protein